MTCKTQAAEGERVVDLSSAGLFLAVPNNVGPKEAVRLKTEFLGLLGAHEQLTQVTGELSVRDKTLSKICDVIVSYKKQDDTTAQFIQSLGPETKYAVLYNDEIISRSGFTDQAVAVGKKHLRNTDQSSIRVLDGELFAFRYAPYSLLVESNQPIPDALKHIMQLYVQQLGHTERAEAARATQEKVDEMEWLANHDPLTRLANRRKLDQAANSLVRNANKFADRHAILNLDLDGFKAVNDKYGHETGDELLKHVASRIRAECREVDLIARTGGDEFVILCPHLQQDVEAENLAARLVSIIGLPTIISSKHCNIGVSIGIAWWRAEFDFNKTSVADWMRFADDAMYETKRSGKSAYKVAS